MTRDAAIAAAVQTLEATGELPSVRRVNRQLRRVPPWRGIRWQTLLPLLKYQRLPADARQAIRALDEATETARTWTGDRGRMIVTGEAAKDRVITLQQREAAAGHPVEVFEQALTQWSEAASWLIWKGPRPSGW